MEETIKRAISLRKQSRFAESRSLLASLLGSKEHEAQAHLHIAWTYDNEGKESLAVDHYVAAISGDLAVNERFEALLGLASTYRSLGLYHDALRYFDIALAEYPNALEIKPFYAMCLYNLGRHKEAVALLLELLVTTTNSEEIRQYQRAITLYAKDLDKTW